MSDCRFGVSPVNYPDPDPVGFSFDDGISTEPIVILTAICYK